MMYSFKNTVPFSYRTLETMNKNIPETIMIMGEITKRARRRDEQEKLV